MEIPVRKRAKGPSTVDIGEFTTFNRGPITSLFVALPSCTATLTMDQKSIGLFAIHAGGQYFDPACIPMGWPGNEVASLTWGDYYCKLQKCSAHSYRSQRIKQTALHHVLTIGRWLPRSDPPHEGLFKL